MSEMDAVVLSTHFRELQQEKKKLDNKLEHLRMKRRDLESKQDTVARKNLLLNQKSENMSRTVNVAKMKVQETQLHVDKLQKMSDGLQKTVNEIKQQIATEEKNREDHLLNYQVKYDELAENFRHAKKYYVDTVLNVEESRCKVSFEVTKDQVSSNNQVVNMVSERLQKMKILKENVPEEKPPKSVWCQYMDSKDLVFSLFQKEGEAAHLKVEQCTNTVQENKNKMNALEAKLVEMKS